MDRMLTPFEFTLPTKIVWGPGCVKNLAHELALAGGHKPLIVTDRGIRGAGILDKVTALLDEAGIEYAVFDGVEANPKDLNVAVGAEAARAAGTDSLIAVGGGSPIDCAKSIGVLLAHDATDIRLYEGKTAATKPQPPFLTIPTTAGTGSEITFSSVITNTAGADGPYKMTVKSPYTAATTALCDPELTLTVPASITAATGMDALTHAIEGYTATCSEPVADAVALYAVELICKNLVRAVEHGDDLEARAGMLMGSLLAGMAFSHADVASVHCVAEALGSVYDQPHGTCNAIFLPYVMEYNMDYCVARYARIARAMGLSFETEEEGAKKAVAYVKQLAVDVHLPDFKSLGTGDDKFELLAEMSERNGSNPSNPRPMTKADYLTVLRRAYAG